MRGVAKRRVVDRQREAAPDRDVALGRGGAQRVEGDDAVELRRVGLRELAQAPELVGVCLVAARQGLGVEAERQAAQVARARPAGSASGRNTTITSGSSASSCADAPARVGAAAVVDEVRLEVRAAGALSEHASK